MKPEIGAVLDGYKLLAQIGSGSCGTVYQAENIISKRIFALKILSAKTDLAQRELAALRLFQSIEHPNLIRIHHIGQTGDTLFYTMDPCECSLAQRKVTPEELVPIAQKLAGALAALHEHGLIHRDIKPDNIFFRNGEIVLGDIGLVIRKGNATFAGSPGFMVPGQSTPDEYTDCYALAKTLYCALSGKEPEKFPYYDGTLSDAASLIMRATLAVCSDKPKIRTAAELLRFLNEPGTTVRKRNFKSWVWLSAVILIPVLAAGGLCLHLHFQKQNLPVTPKTIQTTKQEKQQTTPSRPGKNMTLPPQSDGMSQETLFFMIERERLAQSAEKCIDAEEKFKLEYQVCMVDLLISLLMRKNSMPLSKFYEEQKNLVDISNYVEKLQTAGKEEESRYIPPEQKQRLQISAPELNERWNQVNTEWESRKKSYVLEILREIRKTGKKPEEILKKMAESDKILQFFGTDQLEFIEQYRNAYPETVKNHVLTEYLTGRKEFLQSLHRSE